MSVIIDYLKKTEEDAPSADKPGTVPPALLTAGRNRRRGGTVLRLVYIGVIVSLCALICLFFIPQLKPGIADEESPESISALSLNPPVPEKRIASITGGGTGTVNRERPGKRIPAADNGGVINSGENKAPTAPSQMPDSSASNGMITLPSSNNRGNSREESVSDSRTSTTLDGIPSFNFGTTSPGITPSGNNKVDSSKTIAIRTITSSNEAVMPPGEKPLIRVASEKKHSNQKINSVNQPQAHRDTGAGKPEVSVDKPAVAVLPGSLKTKGNAAVGAPSARNGIPLKSADQNRMGKDEESSPKKNVTHYYQMGLLAQKKGRFRDAETFYKRVLAVDPENLPTLTNLAATHIRQGEFRDAEVVVNRILSIDPENPKALVNSGMIHLKHHRYDQAEQLFNRVLLSRPTNEAALINLAYLARKNGNTHLLEEYYKKIAGAHPGNTEALLSYASLMETEKRYPEAVSLYHRCLKVKKIIDDDQLSRRIKKRIGVLERYDKS